MLPISVVMPSYNHAAYVGRAIESVLRQSFGEYEFLIADDGSNDGTRDIIQTFHDKRIQFFPHQNNRGACTVHNELLAQAKGKYVALINSDDMWMEGKLEKQFNYLEKNNHMAGHFGRAVFVNAQDVVLKKDSLSFGRIFDQPNRTQAEWIRFFFDHSNCLCHPSSMIKRECYSSLGGYNNRFRQLPDFDMWVRLVKKYPIYVDNDPLIYFRILSEKNTSSSTLENNMRVMNEHYFIAESFFEDLSETLFYEAFSDRFCDLPAGAVRDLRVEKILQYFVENNNLGKIYQQIGLQKIFSELNDSAGNRFLKENYCIDDQYFQNISGKNSLFYNQNFGRKRSIIKNLIRKFLYL
ncbi:MAG: glycosyltransferase [Acetobacter orientalis]|uniref:glycosyltransferase n=1 Tax=Acetobacter orientalis TaxID=146474 RepID=UPI0039E9A42F